MDNQMTILSSETVMAQEKAAIDIQISTARAYPRNLSDFLQKVETYAGLDTETAEDCFYALKRGRGDEQKVIDGLSVRFAEIIASCWGNLRVQTRIIAIDEKMITAQGIVHDLESNVAISAEVKRRITDKEGRRFSDDMIVVTGNAASSIAFRNAVLKVVPKAVTKNIVEKVKQISLGKEMDVETARTNAIEYFKKLGISEAKLFEHLEVKGIDDIDKEKLLYLKGLRTAIKEGTATIDDVFNKDSGVKEPPKNVFGNAKKEQPDPAKTEKVDNTGKKSEPKQGNLL